MAAHGLLNLKPQAGNCHHCKKSLRQIWVALIKSTPAFGAKKILTSGENKMIFLQYLDETGIAYLIMLTGFLLMARLESKTAAENKRLRRRLKDAVLGE